MAARLTLASLQTTLRDKMDHKQKGFRGYRWPARRDRVGPPGNANAFQHELAAVQRRRTDGELTAEEQDIRGDILAGLIAD
jgi:hypothetical protein